jgi:SET domain-containing protein
MARPPHKPLPRIARRRSGIEGWGVFAAEAISKNTRIIDYAGELIHNSVSEEREDRYLREGHIWVFRVNRNWSRDANVGGNIARFINHACAPNCWFEVVDKTIWIRAGRNIRRGEELTYDYRIIGEKTMPCRCRPGCPNMI